MLINALKHFKDNEDYFKSLFPEIGDALKDRYYNIFNEEKITIDKAWRKFEVPTTQITLAIAEHNQSQTQTLSHGGQTKTMLLRNDLIVKVISASLDITRIVHRLIQSAFLIFKDSFLKAGYLTVDFIASKELLPVENVAFQDQGRTRVLPSTDGFLYEREMIFTSQKTLEVPPLVADSEIDVTFILNVPSDITDITSQNIHTDTVYTTI
jgi:hypothetical protein